MRKGRKWKRLLSVILAASVINTTLCSSVVTATGNPQSGESVVYYDAENNTEESLVQDNGQKEKNTSSSADSTDTAAAKDTSNAPETSETDNTKNDGSSDGEKKDSAPTTTDSNDTQKDKNEKDISSLYENGQVKIYNLSQLKKVGTGEQIHSGDVSEDTFGTGDALTDENENALIYGNDTQYMLMNDIPMSGDDVWTLPEGFGGSFTGQGGTADSKLYDAENDTIYVYNNYQLATINDPDALKTVMSNDMIAEEFGMGQIVFADEANETQLEYTDGHNYVLKAEFTSEMPEMKATALVENDGRKFQGQVIFTAKDGDKDTAYILIGNEDQLRAIGTDELVYTAIYQARYVVGHFENLDWIDPYWTVDKDDNGNPIMLYGGDADLKKEQNGTKDYEFQQFDHASGASTGRCGVNQQTGEIDPDMDIENSGYRYTDSANYIIFRDIDLSAEGENSDGSDDPWDPLMFYGNMIGAKADGTHTIESLVTQSSETEVAPANIPVISNVTISTFGTMNRGKTQGVGFFASITTDKEDQRLEEKFTAGKDAISVRNLQLDNVTVDNGYSEVGEPQSGLIKWLLGILTEILDVLPGLGDALESLLNTDDYDITAAATGTFAGRVYGNVEITNCSVTNAQSVSSNWNTTGGFVGSAQGKVLYDELFATLDGTLVRFLEELLNVIPLIDLGTLIEVLLDGGLLDIGEMVPTGYVAPAITNCSVGYSEAVTDNTKLLVNNKSSDYYGGFIGYQAGARVKNCVVYAPNGLTVNASNHAGGFAGMTTDIQIVGAFNNLGISIDASKLINNSFTLNSSVDGDVSVTAKKYAGGMSGSLCNSYLVDSGVKGNVTVNATDSYAGGLAGYSTLGEALSLGSETENEDSDLLQVLGGLLSYVVSGDKKADLLSLAGIYPSVIAGCYLNGSATVTATGDYAGGITGRADGTQIISSAYLSSEGSKQSEEEITDTQAEGDEANDKAQVAAVADTWKHAQSVLNYTPQNQGNKITDLVRITAKNYAGGAVGQANAVNMSGILNNTMAPYMKPFTLQNVEIAGSDIQIATTERYAGGAVGAGFGGDIANVKITGLGSVSATNSAGGFAGAFGTADVLNVGGLDVLGLGLVSIKGLVKLGSTLRITVTDSSVTGKDAGYTVEATGTSDNAADEFYAGGFIGNAMAVKAENCTADKINTVKASNTQGYAGGFAGITQTEGLADTLGTEGEGSDIISLISISDLLSVAPYLMCEFDKPLVNFTGDAVVTADVAGGFAGELQSTRINRPEEDEAEPEAADAVTGIRKVTGSTYAGGFAGRIVPGAFVSAGKGIGILEEVLSVNINDLLSLINAYYSEIYAAGVLGDKEGFSVSAKGVVDNDSNSGSAGGYAGYGNALTIRKSRVQNLSMSEINAPEDLQVVNGDSYFTDGNQYAVIGARYAGGYAGKIDIGSTAAVDGKLNLTGSLLDTNNIATALQVMASEISDSDVSGVAGGFSVLAGSPDHSNDGIAGGYVGSLEGSEINNSDVNGFEYVIGEAAAGGYAGRMIPGDVLGLLDDTSLLGKVANLSGTIASLMEYYIPIINNSSTNAVPCGGVVRAECAADGSALRGTAGGYVGYSEGGRIVGDSKECMANRIRSVYGYEYAGGFTGYMKAADTLGTGSISLLNGLISVDNLLGVLDIVYPIQTNTAVYGPLQNLDIDTWNKWADAIGSKSSYKEDLTGVDTEEEMKDFVSRYSYGYDITAGRSEYSADAYAAEAGTAGGYVGTMQSGKIIDGQTYQVGTVTAMSAAGGFAGDVKAGGIAEIGSVTLLGNNINLGNLVQAVTILIPNIKGSGAQGFTSGMRIEATGTDKDHGCGDAGGFAGRISGGHINTGDNENTDGQADTEKTSCTVTRLKGVSGTNHAGGFAGLIESGAAAALNTKVSEDENPIQNLIDAIWKVSGGNLASVLDVVVPNIEYASVSGMDTTGFVVYGGADYAGGFAGMLNGAVIGREEQTDGIQVNNLKRVVGKKYAGGMFGLADVSSAASVTKGGSSILDLIKTQEVGLLENFRTYIYETSVKGVESGFSVEATEEDTAGTGTTESTVYEGNAGGFGGSMQNGVVQKCDVTNLSSVRAKSYTGGFIGHMDKSGTLDADSVNTAGDLLDLSAGVLDVWGTHVYSSSVSGIETGFTVRSTGGSLTGGDYVQAVAGGFAGYANNATITRKEESDPGCTVTNLKQVSSDEIAGGFAGKTDMAYLANIEADSPLVNVLLRVVQGLLDVLHAEELQNINLADLKIPGLAEVEVLKDGNLAYVNLLGIKISVSLGETDDSGNQTVHVTIGDSEITLHCNEDGKLTDGNTIGIHLIKANRTRISYSSVKGIETGYDVFGGKADNESDGEGKNGFAGGFVGYNNEGLLENNQMIQADTIRAEKEQIGAFSGSSQLDTVYGWNTLSDIEGNNNIYNVYREWNDYNLKHVCNKDGVLLSEIADDTATEVGGIKYYIYPVKHMLSDSVYKHGDVWEGAYQTTDNNKVRFNIKVYVSSAQADLMLGTPTYENLYEAEGTEGDIQDPCDVNGEHTIQKIWKDNNNVKRPDSVKVTLKQDGQEFNPVNSNETNPITMTDQMAGSDDSIWTTTIHAPTYKDNENNKYSYSVAEEQIDGYATIYKDLNYYTHQIFNYLPTELMKEDTVVIDYGLPVDIDVLTNDTNVGGKFAGIAIKNGTETFDTTLVNEVTDKMVDGFTGPEGQAVSGDYGTAQMLDGDKIRFTPTTMSMDSFQKIMYSVKLPDNQDREQYVYSIVTVVPATTIYYEDEFIGETTSEDESEVVNTGIEYKNGTTKTTGSDAGVWKQVKDDTNAGASTQDTDRPGAEEIEKAWDQWYETYGNDTHYADDYKYSNGSSHCVKVDLNNSPVNGGTFPTAEFEFTGTGFDVISVTSGDTGTVRVDVYKAAEKNDQIQGSSEAADPNNPILEKSYTMDTYYGYKHVNKAEDGEEENWIWEVDSSADGSNALYQVPIIKIEGLDYGTHKVVITPIYSPNEDHHYQEGSNDNSYTIYLDAIRIYNPAGTDEKHPNDEEYEVIQNIYNMDGESAPGYKEIRDLLLNANQLSEIDEEYGVVFVDGEDELSDIKDYEEYGPKNEVYLESGQGISFYLWSDFIPDKVQISAKLAQGAKADLAFALAVPAEDSNGKTAAGWTYYNGVNYTVTSAYDLNYDLTNLCEWESVAGDDGEQPVKKYRTRYPIVVANKPNIESQQQQETQVSEGSGILSLTNIRWNIEQEDLSQAEEVENKTISLANSLPNQNAGSTGDLIAMSSWDNVEAAYYFLNAPEAPAEHTVTVSYVDQNGNTLADSQTMTGEAGSAYDVTEAAGKEIEGYEIAEVRGEVAGVLDSDVEITVVYAPKTYTLRVEYVDQTGLMLADPYMQEGVAHGTEYDVTDQTEKEFEGYRFISTAGGSLQGTMENDVTIRVIYEKLTYDLAVYYIDSEGGEIAEPYIQKDVPYGTAYDLTAQTEKKIDGYTQRQISGDEVTGVVNKDVVIHVVYAETTAAVPLTYTVLVRYTDKDGNSLADPYLLADLDKDAKYDVTAQTEKEIDGYTIGEVTGDAVTGQADSCKVITVVYLKNYTIRLNYIDQEGNVLAAPYMTEAPEGSAYDLEEQTEKEFEGYQLVGTAGGFTEGTLEDDLTINVIYKKLTYSIIVNYVDQNGNVLADPFVETEVPYGTSYDVTGETQKEIDGYSLISVSGDQAQGTVSGNVILNVVYEKEKAEEPKPVYSVIVNYIDKNGNALAQPYVQSELPEGSSYDVTSETGKEISGYTLAEIKGDDVSGIIDGSKVINVMYLQNYTVTVSYEGTNGEVLADPYTITGVDGDAYDVTVETQKQFEGYGLNRITGDDVKGILDQNKVIKVEYLKETFSVTVQYKDRAGNDLAEPYILADVPYGTAYDVTAEAEKAIDGYEQTDICGSPLTGTVTQPVAVTVLYDLIEAEEPEEPDEPEVKPEEPDEPEEPAVYSIMVNYLDRKGNVLAESYVLNDVEEGGKYNVALAAGKLIDGYTLAGVVGDAVYGTADGNKVINVIYLKNYQVKVRYLDEDNNDLTDPYIYEAAEGSIYNVSQQAMLEIDGYEFDELRGQPVWGVLDDNKIVIVKYMKAEEETPVPGGDEQTPSEPETPDEQEPTGPETPEEQEPAEPEIPDEQEPTVPETPEEQEPTGPETPDGQEPTVPETPDGQEPAEPETPEEQEPSGPEDSDKQDQTDMEAGDASDKPEADTENKDTGTADAAKPDQNSAEDDRAVETGDDSNILIPAAGMAAALMAAAALLVLRKKKEKK